MGQRSVKKGSHKIRIPERLKILGKAEGFPRLKWGVWRKRGVSNCKGHIREVRGNVRTKKQLLIVGTMKRKLISLGPIKIEEAGA